MEPKVFLVGAGPGAPGLLTLRAAELLAKADLVIHDVLVPARLLEFARPGAECICVRDLPGEHPDKYPHIHQLLIDRAQRGEIVVRLKGGDPFIFGRGGEEAEALREAGIAYEIVPGVTAALAAAACLDIPLTHRKYASAVAFITGHELPGKLNSHLDWQVLAKFPGTLAIYMGIARLPLITAELLKHGKSPNTPSAIVERASLGSMRTVTAPLGQLDQVRRHAGLEAPGLILIGDVVAHRPTLSWFEVRPLFGKRILVTRPRHQSREMMRRLEELGAVVYSLPTMEIQDPEDWNPCDAALNALEGYHWLVFTSANGVHQFLKRLFSRGFDLRRLGSLRIAVIGPATAKALGEYHLRADLVPESDYSSEGLLAALEPHVSGLRVLLARANRGRDLLPKELAKLATVQEIVVYEQVDHMDAESDIFDHLRRGEIEFVTLTSSNIARTFLAACDETVCERIRRGDIRLVAISPETGRVPRELGLPVAEAKIATTESIISKLRDLAAEM